MASFGASCLQTQSAIARVDCASSYLPARYGTLSAAPTLCAWRTLRALLAASLGAGGSAVKSERDSRSVVTLGTDRPCYASRTFRRAKCTPLIHNTSE